MACTLNPTMPTSCSPELFGMAFSLQSGEGVLIDDTVSSGLPHDDQYVPSAFAYVAEDQTLTTAH